MTRLNKRKTKVKDKAVKREQKMKQGAEELAAGGRSMMQGRPAVNENRSLSFVALVMRLHEELQRGRAATQCSTDGSAWSCA